MSDRKTLIYPIVFLLILAPVFIVALLTYNPGSDCECDCGTLPALTHTHGAGLATAVIDDLQLIFNVSPGATLYKVTDGALELCSGDVTDSALKHITVDVYDARFMLGDRLPVEVTLTIRDATSGALVVEGAAPPMIAAGHGYHFGDNYLVPNGAEYTWEATISPVKALRTEGTRDHWLEPLTWSGTFTVREDGTIVEQAAGPVMLGEFTAEGIHVMISATGAQTLYDVSSAATAALDPAPEARYIIVDVTDHIVNYEEKLPGATVEVTFTRGDDTVSATLDPVIAPLIGLHYGANMVLEPGEWDVTVAVSGLDFLRHAGAAVGLARGTVSDTVTVTVE